MGPQAPALVCPLATAASPALAPLLLGLLGGLALFLYGMEQLASALKAVAGDRMRRVLARLTSNRFLGALTGTLVTALIQSSSVTTVLVVGFVAAGLMTLVQSVGVIIGANVGTTITAQIIAFQMRELALVLVAGGFALWSFARIERLRLTGVALLGLGILFLGMEQMGDAMAPLKTWEPFYGVMASLENPALGILAGAVFTALVQASAATAGVVIVLASQGLLTLPAGIAIVLGANIGTCVTALLAATGKPREAQRAAWVHVLFNTLGVLLWIGLLGPLAELVTDISPRGNLPRQIANAHTVFNVANAILFLPFAGLLARAAIWLVPDRPAETEDPGEPRYLDANLLTTPSLALARVRLELQRLADLTRSMLVDILPAMTTGTRSQLARIAARDDTVDRLHGAIVSYLGAVSRQRLTQDQTAELVHLMDVANGLENIGDIIETNLTALGRRRLDQGVTISVGTQQVLRDFHGEVLRAFDAAQFAEGRTDPAAARLVTGMKPAINRMMEAAERHGADRLLAPEPHRLAAYAIERDMFENLKRIYYFAKRMARRLVSAHPVEPAPSPHV